MRIGITFNEVLRDFLGQLVYTYDKYVEKINIKEGDIKSFNLLDYFPFKTQAELNRFMYQESPLEIFGHADQATDGLFNKLNYFLREIEEEGEHEVILISREVDKSISATLFFLSKVGCRANNIRFVSDTSDKWNHVDILITANPVALECKPTNKLSVKVKASYNENSGADFTIDSLADFLQDENLRNSILNTKITTYEEIEK